MKGLLAAALCFGVSQASAAGRIITAPVTVPGAAMGAMGLSGAALLKVPALTSGFDLSAPLTPSISAPMLRMPGPATALPAPWPVLNAPSVRAAASAIAAPSPAKTSSLRAVLGRRVSALTESRSQSPSGAGAQSILHGIFEGKRSQGAAVSAQSPGPVVNYEGVPLTGPAAKYYKEVKRIVDKYEGKVDVSESLDVMDDSYGDVWAKLKAIESLAMQRDIEDHNTHLERTLTWVDGVMHDHGKTVAVQTHRVYFHHAGNPRSEIEEGIRRTDRYLEDTARLFLSGGKAESELGRFDEIVLAFDTRGYAEIKDHIKSREHQFQKAFKGRFRFLYLDEVAEVPNTLESTRAELKKLIRKYEHDEGLSKIIGGVIYSRYVGLLLELRTVEHYVDKGYSLVQSGHELFDEEGKYVTELDLIVRGPEGATSLVEAKSARVPLPFSEVMRDKIIAKLDTYKEHWAELEASAGSPIDEVVFAMDVGPNSDLVLFLRGKEKVLAKKYGFPVRFLFIESIPRGAAAPSSQSRLKRPGRRKRRR